MSSLTYHSRLQRALNEFALQDRTSIEYEEVVRNIRYQFRACNKLHGRRYEHHIHAAVKREIRARRVIMESLAQPARIVITPAGLRFYREWGSIPLYDRKDARLRYLTIRQLRAHTCALRNILKDISDNIAVYYRDNDDMNDYSTLPGDLYTVCSNVNQLQVQNMELEAELNLQEGRKQRLVEFS